MNLKRRLGIVTAVLNIEEARALLTLIGDRPPNTPLYTAAEVLREALDEGDASPVRCDSVHSEGENTWRCALIAGHAGLHAFQGYGRVSSREWR